MTRSPAVARYVAGATRIEQFERELEIELLLAAGRDHPVPPGWEPLPPCDHEWVEITAMGDLAAQRLCIACGVTQYARYGTAVRGRA